VPTSLSFGTIVLGSTSKAKTVTMTNTGNQTLNITNIAASGDFALTTSTKPCGSTLAVGANCKIAATFTPTQLGSRTGAITITDNAANSPQTVPLSGTGKAQVTLTPVSATYPKTLVGSTSTPKIFTLRNNLNTILHNIVISTTGDFAVSTTNCQANLTSNASCSIYATFTPTQTGTRTGTLQVSDSANNSPQISNLTGTGK
jgi:ketosteroid isomerase-like protein